MSIFFRFSVVSLQLGCCKASLRRATPVSVMSFFFRFSVVSLQLGCCKALHSLVTMASVISTLCRLSVVNFHSNLSITSSYSSHSSVKVMFNNFSSDTRQCSLFSELKSRCIPDSVSRDFSSSNFLTVTNLSENLSRASPPSSLFSSLIMSNTNDTPK